MMDRLDVGSVYLHKDHKFEDGTIRDKYLICVGYALNDKPLICFTTSKTWQFQKNGEHFFPNEFHLIKQGQEDVFSKDTRIIFNRVQLAFDGYSIRDIQYKGRLKEQNIQAIQKGILNSDDVAEVFKKGIKRHIEQTKSLDISSLQKKFRSKFCLIFL